MPNGPISSTAPVVEVDVTFNPPGEVVANPDVARVHWGRKETIRWRLRSSDRRAVLQEIIFAGADPKGPLPEMRQDPEDPLVWEGGTSQKVTGTFKYDVVVRDGDGNDVVLDPALVLGNPPE